MKTRMMLQTFAEYFRCPKRCAPLHLDLMKWEKLKRGSRELGQEMSHERSLLSVTNLFSSQAFYFIRSEGQQGIRARPRRRVF
jgi:hypothetical protein